jgi:hypothetical protein
VNATLLIFFVTFPLVRLPFAAIPFDLFVWKETRKRKGNTQKKVLKIERREETTTKNEIKSDYVSRE